MNYKVTIVMMMMTILVLTVKYSSQKLLICMLTEVKEKERME